MLQLNVERMNDSSSCSQKCSRREAFDRGPKEGYLNTILTLGIGGFKISSAEGGVPGGHAEVSN